MAPQTPRQIALRNRIEGLIRLVEPGLNMLLPGARRRPHTAP